MQHSCRQMRKGNFSTFWILRDMQLGVVSKMGKRVACAKFKEKSNSYNGQREYTQVAQDSRSHRKSRLQPRISASVFSGFKSDRTFLESFEETNRRVKAKIRVYFRCYSVCISKLKRVYLLYFWTSFEYLSCRYTFYFCHYLRNTTFRY